MHHASTFTSGITASVKQEKFKRCAFSFQIPLSVYLFNYILDFVLLMCKFVCICRFVLVCVLTLHVYDLLSASHNVMQFENDHNQ